MVFHVMGWTPWNSILQMIGAAGWVYVGIKMGERAIILNFLPQFFIIIPGLIVLYFTKQILIMSGDYNTHNDQQPNINYTDNKVDLNKYAIFVDGVTSDPSKDYKSFLKSLSALDGDCLLYTSPSPRDLSTSRMPSSA